MLVTHDVWKKGALASCSAQPDRAESCLEIELEKTAAALRFEWHVHAALQAAIVHSHRSIHVAAIHRGCVDATLVLLRVHSSGSVYTIFTNVTETTRQLISVGRTPKISDNVTSRSFPPVVMDFLLLLVATFIAWLAITHCFLPLVRFINLQVTLLKIPAPERPHWLLGHLPLFMVEGNEEGRYERWLKDPRTKLMRVHIPFIHVNLVHPETASEVFKTAEPKDEAYEFLRPWLGDGLLLSTGKRWARDRRLLTRGFHFDILRGYFPVYKEAVGIMLDQWAELGRQDDPQTINVSKCSKLLTLDIILRCIMSFESHCQTEGADKNILEYVEAVFGMSQCINQRYCSRSSIQDSCLLSHQMGENSITTELSVTVLADA